MHYIKNIIFVAIVVSIAMFAWYQYQQQIQDQQLAKTKGLIFPHWKNTDIKSIRIQKDKEVILLEKLALDWHLKSPIKDLANKGAVLNYLDSVLSEKVTVLNTTDESSHSSSDKSITGKSDLNQGSSGGDVESVNWSKYGLGVKDSTVRVITLVTSDNTKLQFFISNYSAYDGSFFLRATDDLKLARLLLGGVVWAQLTGKPVSYFRDYSFFHHTGKRPMVLEYRFKGGDYFAFQRGGDYEWQWLKEGQGKGKKLWDFTLSQNKVESYFTGLANVQFNKKDVYDASFTNKKKYGLLKPDMVIRMRFDGVDKKDWVAKLSQKGKLFYVLLSDRDYIFTLSQEQVKALKLNKEKLILPPPPPKPSSSDKEGDGKASLGVGGASSDNLKK